MARIRSKTDRKRGRKIEKKKLKRKNRRGLRANTERASLEYSGGERRARRLSTMHVLFRAPGSLSLVYLTRATRDKQSPRPAGGGRGEGEEAKRVPGQLCINADGVRARVYARWPSAGWQWARRRDGGVYTTSPRSNGAQCVLVSGTRASPSSLTSQGEWRARAQAPFTHGPRRATPGRWSYPYRGSRFFPSVGNPAGRTAQQWSSRDSQGRRERRARIN